MPISHLQLWLTKVYMHITSSTGISNSSTEQNMLLRQSLWGLKSEKCVALSEGAHPWETSLKPRLQPNIGTKLNSWNKFWRVWLVEFFSLLSFSMHLYVFMFLYRYLTTYIYSSVFKWSIQINNNKNEFCKPCWTEISLSCITYINGHLSCIVAVQIPVLARQ